MGAILDLLANILLALLIYKDELIPGVVFCDVKNAKRIVCKRRRKALNHGGESKSLIIAIHVEARFCMGKN